MAGTSGQPGSAVIDRLWREPYSFDFFQAVRLIEWMQPPDGQRPATGGAVGTNLAPSQEAVRFRSLVSLTFPPSAITALKPGAAERPAEMTVSFFGLHGPAGALPQHYTSHLMERCHVRNSDFTMRDFFDLFNHRAISLFYRAWEKYHFTTGFERSRREGGQIDLFTFCLTCLVGLGTPHLTERLQHNPQSIVYYGGHFAHRVRNASALEAILQDYFELPMRVEQFKGQWLYLSAEDQTSLPTAEHPNGRNCALGIDVVVGERVWDIQSKFRIRVGPLNYDQFSHLMPNGDALEPLCDLVRFYAGPQFDFDVQVVLAAAEVPFCELNSQAAVGPRLGWNTWLVNQRPKVDAEDPVFWLQSS
jgi:type VI secretion system protein ImpH